MGGVPVGAGRAAQTHMLVSVRAGLICAGSAASHCFLAWAVPSRQRVGVGRWVPGPGVVGLVVAPGVSALLAGGATKAIHKAPSWAILGPTSRQTHDLLDIMT